MNQFPQAYGQNFENENGNFQSNAPQNYQQPQQQAPSLDFSNEIKKMISTAGTLELTEKQNDILYSPVKDHDVFIKPDGLIYLSWMKYSERLNKAFGGTSWTMIPEGTPKIMGQKNLIIWSFHFVIKGVYCGFAIGEQQYFDNGRMSYGEACEGAKSNALMRLCKNIGIGLELWDKNFIDRWVKTYAESYQDRDGKTKWKLKAGVQDYFLKLQAQEKMGGNTTPPAPAAQTTTNPTPTPTPTATPTVNEAEVVESNPTAEAKKRGRKPKTANEEIPMEKINDSELGGKTKSLLNENTQPYYDSIIACTAPNQIRPIFDEAKLQQSKGLLTQEELELLRETANEHFVKLNAKI